eukprot:COSAG06_NODE_7599_length_2446_cov_1.212186_1_plen_671_part_01
MLRATVLGLAAAAGARAAVVPHCGDITADETWAAADDHVLACQTFVKDGATLTIEAGVTVYAETIASTYSVVDCTFATCNTAASCICLNAAEDAPCAADGSDDTDAVCKPFTSVLVVEMGGMIAAAGTATAPITFTANVPVADLSSSLETATDSATGAVTVHGTRGNWGGLIILGKAPVHGGSRSIEGLADATPYGGLDPNDSSGTLQYVRVWHGGAAIAADNEINGITFGGVGAGTTVDHCEVAMNVDDGFEFFGGTVNAKYLSTLYVGDDAFDTDKGYQGKMQYLFGMIGTQGHYLAEMDGNKVDSDQVYSAPQVMSMTGVGVSSSAGGPDTMMRLREQGAGQYSNVLLGKVASDVTGIRHDCESGATGDDAKPIVTQDAPIMLPETLYVSDSIIMTTMIHGAPFGISDAAGNDGCAGSDITTAIDSTADVLTAIPVAPNEANRVADSIDLTPTGDAVDAANVDAAFDTWFDTVTYSGAFSSSDPSWLDGWSYLDCVQGVLAGGTLTCNNPNDALPASYDSTLCGDITTDTSISGNVLLGCQTFVKTGATLTIAPGTTIYGETIASTYDASVVTDCTAELCTAANSCIYDADNAACTPFTSVLVVEMGGMIEAPGTAAAPITFTAKATTAEMDSTGSDTTITDSTTGYTVAHGTRGNWGGLIILGNAPV